MCDCLVALGAPTLFAKNSDRPPAEEQVVEWHPPRRDSGVVQCTHIGVAPWSRETVGFLGSRPTWAWGVEHGVNEAGVAVGNETIYTTLDPRGTEPGLPGIDLVRLALERAASASSAVDVISALIEQHGQGGSGHRDKDRPYWSSFLIADASSAFVVETSGRLVAVESVDANRAISNRTTIAWFDAEHRHPRQPVDTLVNPRLEASNAVLAKPVTADSLKEHLRSHAGGPDGWTVCMHAGVEATTAALVATLPDGPARFLVGSPCESVFVPLNVGPLAGVLRPGPADLEAQLERDFRPGDPTWNAEALATLAHHADRLRH